MKSVGGRAFFLLAGLLLATCFGRAAAAGEAVGGSQQAQLDEIKTRLAALEGQQQESLSKREKILQQIDQVRVWARHSGGGKAP